MFGPWIETFIWLRGLFPDFAHLNFRVPHIHFNFILLHYIYLISLTIIGSIILYGGGNLEYIDCLFFASGSATQSGLNTVDLNLLYLYQQVVIMLLTCIATPIFINTFVVFVRLYWFEKRFQHVVLEAQKFRRSRDRSHTRSQAKEDGLPEFDREERGVGNRKIVVMHPSARTMELAEKLHENGVKSEKEDQLRSSSDTSAKDDSSTPQREPEEDEENDNKASGTDGSEEVKRKRTNSESPAPLPRRGITFADELQPPMRVNSELDILPIRRSTDQHIAFLENQRNPKDKGTLYIPGPRDFDRGQGPLEIKTDYGLGRTRSNLDTPLSPSNDDESRKFHRRIAEKMSFENAFNKAKHGVASRLHPGAVDEVPEGSVDGTERPSIEDAETPTSLRRRGRAHTFTSFMTSRDEDVDPMPYLSYQATIGRNSAFVNLTEEQREELGGIEYRALKTLAVTLVVFYVGFHLLAMLCFLPWIVRDTKHKQTLYEDGISPVWWGFFTPASHFNDLGFTLTPDSMLSFQFAVFPLIMGSFFIVIGNTGFPCMLRLVIWILSKIIPRGTSLWEEYRFLLDHPRRCFTLLFPSKATWWLFWILFLLNGIDLLFFVVLDLGDETVASLPAGIQVLNGWYQAASTRTAGFAVVNLADLHPGVQVSYLIMMYISVFPIAISIRRTNVYEEKSLGIWDAGGDPDESAPTKSYIGNHLRRQLSFDLWYVFMGLFIISIVEGGRLGNNKDYAFTIFSVLFEVVSAYGTVGLSLGYPGVNTSFSGQFHVLSKLVIIAMQLRGRHRGLPYALDKAILLPSEEQHRKENESHGLHRTRTFGAASTISRASVHDGAGENTIEDDEDIGDTIGHLPTRRMSTNSYAGSDRSQRRKRNGLAKLIGSALSAGPSAKRD